MLEEINANNLYKNKKYNEAINIYLKLIDSDYKIDIIYSNLAACYLQNKDYFLALNYSLKSVQNNLQNSIGWGRVGYSYKGLKKYDNALKSFKIAYSLNKKKIYKNEIIFFNNKLDNKINKDNIFNLLLNDKNLLSDVNDLKNDILSLNYNKIFENKKINNLIENIISKLVDK